MWPDSPRTGTDDRWHARYRILILAYRLSQQMRPPAALIPTQHAGRETGCTAERSTHQPSAGSAVIEMQVVRARSTASAHDLALMQVIAASALITDATVVVDVV